MASKSTVSLNSSCKASDTSQNSDSSRKRKLSNPSSPGGKLDGSLSAGCSGVQDKTPPTSPVESVGEASSSVERGSPRKSFWRSKRLKAEQAPEPTMTLADLTVGKHSSSCIKFRVSHVSRLQSAKVFLMRAVDESGSRIIKAFSDDAKIRNCQLDCVYTLANFTVVPKYFGEEEEVVCQPYSKLVACSEDFSALVPINAVKLDDLSKLEDKSFLDVIGMIVDVEDVVEGKTLRRSIYITDESKEEIKVTFWGDDSNVDLQAGVVIALCHAEKGSYSTGQETTPTLSVNQMTTRIWIKPDHPRAVQFQLDFQKALEDDEAE